MYTSNMVGLPGPWGYGGTVMLYIVALNGTTTTAMALEAMQNTITGSSTVSKRYSTRPTTWSHYYSIIYTGTSTKYSKLNI